MSVYYNEIDPYAAQWLRNLITAGLIADGVVDERSIEDVQPNDLREFTQVHFFAGIGVWSLSLRRAGWADDRRVWTGSCPCQPFSAAGKGAGFSDERHLWPAMHHLIRECRPPAVFGEQVASADAAPWLDLVQTDLEGMGYAFGAVPFPSASVGAPHIRDRLFWVGHALRNRPEVRGFLHGELPRKGSAEGREFSGLADTNDDRRGALPLAGIHDTQRHAEPCGGIGGVADAIVQQRPNGQPGISHEHDAGRWVESAAASTGLRGDMRPGPVNGFWADADWLRCRDGRWRPVEPGSSPLAHGVANRVGRLRAYGNAINAIAAETFIRASMT